MPIMTRLRFLCLLVAFTVQTFAGPGAFAQGPEKQAPEKKDLKVGFVPGPYIDEFKVGVAPELQKKGYQIRYVEFSTGLEANNAVFKSEIDANVMQHTVFLNSYNERQNTDLVGIVHVPTPPMGIYSKKHALDDVDFAAIQGNFAIFSGLKLTNAFALEKMTMPYINVVAVKRGNAETAWAKDIAAAYKSPSFKAAILADRFYDGFSLPDYMK
ncbi:MetQ/NlpA family ABC transporter substrate-binding protein [Bradyrhizobium sp. SZCCHNPS2010]|uniref:MetQ/NlpA family ABC transporter substrate-binding protein n=1 Tax=Bradyrhizobium sp. SZCCHNPS2010 TaxID=3057333 RepID=UPI002916A8B1|nr:MetQ/NlpA family ABC transporter substrate-binding protein [Bradyrhizobium sp. SZCCHNPS2010]